MTRSRLELMAAGTAGVVSAFAAKSGIQLIFAGSGAATDCESFILLPRLGTRATAEQLKMQGWLADHEIAHGHFTLPYRILSERVGTGSHERGFTESRKQLHNMLEDVNIEVLMSRCGLGFAQNLLAKNVAQDREFQSAENLAKSTAWLGDITFQLRAEGLGRGRCCVTAKAERALHAGRRQIAQFWRLHHERVAIWEEVVDEFGSPEPSQEYRRALTQIQELSADLWPVACELEDVWFPAQVRAAWPATSPEGEPDGDSEVEPQDMSSDPDDPADESEDETEPDMGDDSSTDPDTAAEPEDDQAEENHPPEQVAPPMAPNEIPATGDENARDDDAQSGEDQPTEEDSDEQDDSLPGAFEGGDTDAEGKPIIPDDPEESLRQRLGEIVAASKFDKADYSADTQFDSVEVAEHDDDVFQQDAVDVMARVSGARRALASSLFAQTRDRTIRSRKRGALDGSRLAHAAVGTSARVFKVTRKGRQLDTDVELVIDMSGSMSGAKIVVARKMATLLGEACSMVSGIQFEIVGFTTHAVCPLLSSTVDRKEALRHFVFKDAKKPWRSEQTRLGSLTARENNIDGESLIWAAKRLNERRSKRKVMIVLSDGAPAGTIAADLGAHLTNSIAIIREAGIEIYAIGICTAAPVRFYGERSTLVMPDLAGADEAFFDRFAEVLSGGGFPHAG